MFSNKSMHQIFIKEGPKIRKVYPKVSRFQNHFRIIVKKEGERSSTKDTVQILQKRIGI